MKCPNCAMAQLATATRNMPYAYKGENTIIRAVKGDWCPACGEAVLDMAESARVSREMLAFNQGVNARLFSPEEIARVRERLHLTQQEAAVIFGGGINAFSRYESGKTKPPVALLKLLRLLNKHPELLDELRIAA